MKKWISLEIFLFALLYSLPLHSEEQRICDVFQKPKDILQCILLNAPENQRGEIEILKHSAAEKTAAQRPNPEIDARILLGAGGNENDVLSEVNLYHPWELGGKRGGRIEKARGEKEVAVAEKKETLEEVAIQTVTTLHRLRQIRSELTTLDENHSTYQHIVSLFKNRPLLSPEQETSLVVFQLALDESRLKKTALKNEEIHMKADLKKRVGFEIPITTQLLPRPPQPWPTIPIEQKNSVENWSRVKTAEAELKSAQASSRVARSDGWPTLKIGPSVETESPLTGTNAAVGIALATDLPFYQRNKGGKAEAVQGERLASLNLELIKKEGAAEKERLISEYNLNLQALRSARAQHAMEKKHKEIESLFERGLIPSTLMLETHRQIFDFQQELHQAELRGIEALWRIYALEGRLLEENL